VSKEKMQFSYYPGCSLHSTGKEFDQSVKAVFDRLGISLQELEDWNCCSASSAHSINRDLSLALPARNLAIAQEAGMDVIMPCAACFNRHKTAEYELIHNPQKREFIQESVGFVYEESIRIRPPLEVIHTEIGLEDLHANVKKPLDGMKVVGYYGCLLVRPHEVTGFENPENPTIMMDLLSALDAQVMTWSNATDCCGGGLALTKPAVAARMVNRLVERAREAGAEAIVTSCPLCQMNLEMRQSRHLPTPIFYFTELMGLAFGLPEADSWWGKHLVNPKPLLHQAGL
jgi:heterodisulfide reductase subunit B